MEVYVVSGTRRGRLDLYDIATNEYYEVKSVGASLLWTTDEQMRFYDNAKIRSRFPGLAVCLDMTPTRGKNSRICGSTKYDIYDITYFFEKDGLIAYKVSVNRDRLLAKQAIAIGTAAGIAAAAMCASGQGSACPGFARVTFYW